MLILSGVVDEDIERAETFHVRRDARYDVVLGTNIDLREVRLAASLTKLVGGRVAGFLVDLGDGHAGAVCRQLLSDAAANALTGAGDKC